MTVHALLQYLKYRWKATGRHGVHSPFVYDFIEHVLLDKGFIAKESVIEYKPIALKYENLMSRIGAYYQYRSKLLLPTENKYLSGNTIDMLVVNGSVLTQWPDIYDKYAYKVTHSGTLIVTDIHKNMANTKEWEALNKDGRVRLSIDVYGLGILFFKPEFKEKQHFVLKY